MKHSSTPTPSAYVKCISGFILFKYEGWKNFWLFRRMFHTTRMFQGRSKTLCGHVGGQDTTYYDKRRRRGLSPQAFHHSMFGLNRQLWIAVVFWQTTIFLSCLLLLPLVHDDGNVEVLPLGDLLRRENKIFASQRTHSSTSTKHL